MADNTQFTVPEAPAAEPDSEKRPCLIMIRGDFIGQVYELNKDVNMLGRGEDMDLVISDISISRRHAMIVNRVDGFHVSDLSSTNGSFVNKVEVNTPTPLREGDKVSLGNVVFKFTYQDEDDTNYHMMLRNMAIKDGLTRIFNRRYFMEVLEKEFDYNRRNRTGLGIILFDIDHFKEVNDTHGHPAGDFILKNIASLVDQVARGYDVFARFGGEEFVVMMRSGTLESAVVLAERIRASIENNVFEYTDAPLQITISLGVAFWSGDDRFLSSEELVRAADDQLYKAKHAGRNCVRYLE